MRWQREFENETGLRMRRTKHDDPSPELQAKLIEAWHSGKSKAIIRSELDVTNMYLEAIWSRLQTRGQLPFEPRTKQLNDGKRAGLGNHREMSEEDTEAERKSASNELLELLRMHHGPDGRPDLAFTLKRKPGAFLPRFMPKRELV